MRHAAAENTRKSSRSADATEKKLFEAIKRFGISRQHAPEETHRNWLAKQLRAKEKVR
jgi:hypothetical protein